MYATTPSIRLFALLVAICAAFFALGAPGRAQALQLRGVSMHVQPQQVDNDPAIRNQEFAMLQAAGATSIRFDVMWPTLEWNKKGQYDPNTIASIDAVFAQARAHGLKVILDLWATPCWASSAPASMVQGCGYGWWERPIDEYPPVNAQDYADMARFVAKRWGPGMAALELWNEPNGGQFFISSDPSYDYARLVRAVYPAVKAVAPNLPVIMSLGGTDTTFLRYLYYYGVRGYYDGIAVHPYGQPTLAGLRAFHAYQLSQGDHTPLWVTEVGWASTVFGEQGQAADIASVLEQLAALPYVAAAEIYDMRDGGTDPSNPEDHFGLIDYGMNPKPAWNAFVATLRSLNGGRSAGGSTPTSTGGSTSGQGSGPATPPRLRHADRHRSRSRRRHHRHHHRARHRHRASNRARD